MIERTEVEIVSAWQPDADPFVSICCTCYNHEKYIAEMLDSVLAQRTDFKFEVIVRDDASIDGSADIVREYVRKFPNIIKPIFEDTNQYSLGVRPMSVVTRAATGKYIALCEGDDYWLVPQKLQSQVEYLEAHSNVSLLFENAEIHEYDVNGKVVDRREFNSGLAEGVIEPRTLASRWITPTATTIFRNRDLRPLYREISGFPFGDASLFLYLAKFGQVHYRNHKSAVYRMLPTGKYRSKLRKLQTAKKMISYYDQLGELFRDFNLYKPIKKRKAKQFAWIIWLCLNEKQYKEAFSFFKAFATSDPLGLIKTGAVTAKKLFLHLALGRSIDQLR